VVLNSGGKKNKKRKKREKITKIVATFVYASSQGQHTHSARTNKNTYQLDSLLLCYPLAELNTIQLKTVCKKIEKRYSNLSLVSDSFCFMVYSRILDSIQYSLVETYSFSYVIILGGEGYLELKT
jgi:hypothetical protein